MRVVSLFSGCGGLDLGLTKAGHDVIMQVEIDPRCRQVLRHHFPGTLLHPNVEQVQTLPKETDIVAAGFPCQDLSPESSTRKGLKGSKTSMVHHVFRLLKASRPVQWVLLENVPGLLDRIHGQPVVMGYVAEQLERLGYSWAYRIINTSGFGDPQRRRRVFIVACLHGDPRDALLADVGSCGSPCAAPCVLCWENGKDLEQEVHAMDLECWRSGGCVGVMPTLTKSNGSRWMIVTPGSETPPGLLAIEDAERLQGFEIGHTWPCLRTEGGVSRDLTPEAHERARFALVGDAVSVPVAWYIGKRLANPYEGRKYTTGNGDQAFDPAAPEAWPRAAWRLAGNAAPREANGLLARGALSELPELLPFTPLSKFLTAIRPGLAEADVRNYVKRLKDKRFEVSQSVQLKLIRTYGMKLDDFQAYPRTAESVVWASLTGWRPKWYPAVLQSRAHASPAVLAQEETGKTLVVFKGEQNKWSSLWVDKVVPWPDRSPEEISDKMDLPDEYARIVLWARAEHDWLRRFDEKGEYMGDGGMPAPSLKRKLGDVAPPLVSSGLLGQALVGRHVEVYWPQDNTFYVGLVQSFNPRNKRPYKIFYAADETVEHLDLPQEQWRLVPSATGGSPPPLEPGVHLPGNSSPSPSVEPLNQSSPASVCFERSAAGSCPVEGPGLFSGEESKCRGSPVECSEDSGSEREASGSASVGRPDPNGGRHSPLASALLQRLTSQVGLGESSGPSPPSSKAPSLTRNFAPAAPERTGASPAAAQTTPATAFPDEPGVALVIEVNERGGTAIEVSEVPPVGGPFSAAVRSPDPVVQTLLFPGLEPEELGKIGTGDTTLATDLMCPDFAPSGLSPGSMLSPSAATLEITRVLDRVELFPNPFERNDATQEAAWRAGLGLTLPEKPARQRKVRQPSAPKPKKIVTEAALIKNPALDGAALVGREVRVLDVKTRLWMWATVESFDATMGFRNTQPWLVRYVDESAEYVNLCLDRCEIVPRKATVSVSQPSVDSPLTAVPGLDRESNVALVESGAAEMDASLAEVLSPS
ncbi:S-adenosyl-L-methionine-dependent methyltransferase superfamily protein [Klebsormidium nitens]|uniref:Cytosine-specific methyltransferase n=1 Tax=Klebsormidium nitens TaxID=105231 RepID=A0A1Y1HWQ5_KLENI|nr:S-adenosyl-L-methionine-dependent methyltransferase superfamily protein [Klebsormidium nitens]|eukprot:GAQ80957.1 S-adenosyl-L-methionine-dependent methyltransferase superfamily protein [Klebsormidium nitens]